MSPPASAPRPPLLDTNMLIYRLKNSLSLGRTEQLALTIVAQQAHVRAITRFEILEVPGV